MTWHFPKCQSIPNKIQLVNIWIIFSFFLSFIPFPCSFLPKVCLLSIPAALHDDRLTAIGANVYCIVRIRRERESKKDEEENREEEDLLTLKDTGPNCLRLKIWARGSDPAVAKEKENWCADSHTVLVVVMSWPAFSCCFGNIMPHLAFTHCPCCTMDVKLCLFT